MPDERNLPASARSTTDANGRTADLRYSKSHLQKIADMVRAGKPVKVPAGFNIADYPPKDSTAARDSGNLRRDSAGTAGSE